MGLIGTWGFHGNFMGRGEKRDLVKKICLENQALARGWTTINLGPEIYGEGTTQP